MYEQNVPANPIQTTVLQHLPHLNFDTSSPIPPYGPFASSALAYSAKSLFSSSNAASQHRSVGHFHFLIPATNSNKNLCRLLLSAVATRFPTPIFINWGQPHDEDPYKVHMKKVKVSHWTSAAVESDHGPSCAESQISPHSLQMRRKRTSLQTHVTRLLTLHKGILDYLDLIIDGTTSNNTITTQHDLVLILDGFDIWLQIPPDVMIQRYYYIIDAANERLKDSLGPGGVKLMRKHGLYQSVLFGPDKICWPEDATRTACWAVPESHLPRWAFGPETDSQKFRFHNRPRWLNSGTILGPAEDVRAVFRATYERIQTMYTIDSDQFYFADIWGIQEYNRRNLSGNLPEFLAQRVWAHDGYEGDGHFEEVTLQVPEVDEGRKEYHITIDYASELFQTNAYYDKYITWGRFDGTPVPPSQSTKNNLDAKALTGRKLLRDAPLDPADPPHKSRGRRLLPEDINATQSPFDHLAAGNEAGDIPDHLRWHDLLLGRNKASGAVWGLIHFTPPKYWLDLWWFRMWYAPYAESIIRSAKAITADTPYTTTRDNRTWFPYIAENSAGLTAGMKAGGGFADTGEWMEWGQLCGRLEDMVFANLPEPP